MINYLLFNKKPKLFWLPTLFIFVFLCVSSSVHADPSSSPSGEGSEKAKALYQKAGEYYEQGEYQDALLLLEGAYALWKNPTILYSIGLSLEKLDKGQEALQVFCTHLVEYPGDKNHSMAESKVQELQNVLKTTCPEEIFVAKALLEETSPTKNTEQSIVTTDPPTSTLSATQIVGYTASGTLVTTGLVFGIVALQATKRLDEAIENNDVQTAQKEQKASTTFGVLSDVFIGVGIVSGGLQYLLYRQKAIKKAKVQVMVNPTGVFLSGKF